MQERQEEQQCKQKRASASKKARTWEHVGERYCLKCSVMSAINNRCRKLTCLQWTVFWPTYYGSQTQAKIVQAGGSEVQLQTPYLKSVSISWIRKQFKKKCLAEPRRRENPVTDRGYGFQLLVIHCYTVYIISLPPPQSKACKYMLIKWHHV